ncbi:MAG: zinc-binding dehydrogenase [Spirochaetota bacterium]
MARGRAVIFSGPGRPFEDVQYPVPEVLRPGEILVRNRLATVCGSDLHTTRGRRSFATPSILGHEVVGEIAALGSDVSSDTAGRRLSEGDRVVWSIAASCGSCYYCRVAGLPQKCSALFKYGHGSCECPPHFNGGFADYTLLREGTSVFSVPESVDDREAAPIGCAAATVVAAFDALAPRSFEHVVIAGAGMLGTYAAIAAGDLHARSVTVVERIADRRDSILRFGADRAVAWDAARDEAVRLELLDATEGFGADIVIEATGDPQIVPLAVDLLRPGGQLVLLGSVYPGSTIRLDPYDLIRKSITMVGSHNYRPDHLLRAVRLVERRRSAVPLIDLAPIVGTLSAETVSQAMETLADGSALRPAIRISG